MTEPRGADDGLLTIGRVAAITDTPATTLRYYEKRGLIDPPARVGGQRRYDPSVIGRLMVIRFCRVAGVSLDVIFEVVTDRSDGRRHTRELALAQLEEIDTQIAQLQLARRMMSSAADCVCPSLEVCACGAMTDVIIEVRALSSKG